MEMKDEEKAKSEWYVPDCSLEVGEALLAEFRKAGIAVVVIVPVKFLGTVSVCHISLGSCKVIDNCHAKLGILGISADGPYSVCAHYVHTVCNGSCVLGNESHHLVVSLDCHVKTVIIQNYTHLSRNTGFIMRKESFNKTPLQNKLRRRFYTHDMIYQIMQTEALPLQYPKPHNREYLP